MRGRFASSVRSATPNEAGVSLIEIMLAMSILATVLVGLGGLMFQIARHTRQSAAIAYRSAASTSGATLIRGLPWDDISGAVGCTTDTTGLLTYDRCVTFVDLSSTLRRVTVVITPTGQLVVPPDTVVIDRTKPRLPSTLKVN